MTLVTDDNSQEVPGDIAGTVIISTCALSTFNNRTLGLRDTVHVAPDLFYNSSVKTIQLGLIDCQPPGLLPARADPCSHVAGN